jgi:hypothetical protein
MAACVLFQLRPGSMPVFTSAVRLSLVQSAWYSSPTTSGTLAMTSPAQAQLRPS